MVFTWDPRKAASNARKHNVGFREAATALEDPLSTTFPDEDHSHDEQRFITIGMSKLGRLLVVAHADRGETIRLISARRATRQERTFYEENEPAS